MVRNHTSRSLREAPLTGPLRFDAFTHKPTSQHSLAYEKASIIFNIAAVLSCHAAVQNRHEESGLKTAYHSFQASAGMFTYINENFLHAPSTDLNHDTVKTLIAIMLAQAQEVFLERQINDGKKVGMLAKLAGQAAYLYSQAVEGVQENVQKVVFEKVWLTLTQAKAAYFKTVAQYYQALADDDANAHGIAIARLHLAEKLAKDANRIANSFPNSPPASSNLGSDTGPTLIEVAKKQLIAVQEKIPELVKDNDFIYHQPVPSEAALVEISKLPAAKAISVSELYQGQDVHRIIGPDIFQRIVPMSVTESASLYDEEKAKLIRAESERADIANGEMAASLDYLKLPGSLNVLKGGVDHEMSIDEEFKDWCNELAGHRPFNETFEKLTADKTHITSVLEQCTKQLDMEESVCEKMRSKYGPSWTQQPSSRLTATLRSDIKNYQAAVDEANTSDAQLYSTFRQCESDFDEMRSAGEADEADVLYQRAMIKAGANRTPAKNGISSPSVEEGDLLGDDFDDSSKSVQDQMSYVDELLRKLNLIKRERGQVLKDLKEKIHNDDISQVLILNKKAITNQDHQLFKAELEKFRPHQTRLLQANHKQSSVLKELTKAYGDLLKDKRIRAEQSKYESIGRQRLSVKTKYRKIFNAFNDLEAGLERAQSFYSEMKSTADSLNQNVTTFVSNRKSEGGELLTQIEKGNSSVAAGGAERERERLSELMERMNMTSSPAPPAPPPAPHHHRPAPLQHVPPYHQPYNPATSPPVSAGYASARQTPMQSPYQPGFRPPTSNLYAPHHYGQMSPPPGQQNFQTHSQHASYSGYSGGFASPPPQQSQQQHQHQMPAGYVPPPPPPGPPPPGGSSQQPQPQPGQSNDPWASLSSWR